jgi:nucleoside-diphosphate-sugar epimerase
LCPVETHPELRGDPYTFAKVKQDEVLVENCRKFDIPYVIVRPGCVYGAGDESINRRVGLGTFGIFLHLGGSNRIPFTYVDNCADAIAMTGLREGVDGEVFNVVDDDLPTSRQYLSMYRRNVRKFRSIYVPGPVSFALCCLWERYSSWSEGQLPPIFNRETWHAYWRNTRYSNAKLKRLVGWTPMVPTAEAFRQYFISCRSGKQHA